jgi:pyruvate kinase
MDRIIRQVEADPYYREQIEASHVPLARGQASVAEALCCAMRRTAGLLPLAVIVCCTSSGATSLRAARERPQAPVLSLTPHLATARRLALAWGVHSVLCEDVADVRQMITVACEIARREGFAEPGQPIVAMAGMPFGETGSTNLLRIAIA